MLDDYRIQHHTHALFKHQDRLSTDPSYRHQLASQGVHHSIRPHSEVFIPHAVTSVKQSHEPGPTIWERIFDKENQPPEQIFGSEPCKPRTRQQTQREKAFKEKQFKINSSRTFITAPRIPIMKYRRRRRRHHRKHLKVTTQVSHRFRRAFHYFSRHHLSNIVTPPSWLRKSFYTFTQFTLINTSTAQTAPVYNFGNTAGGATTGLCAFNLSLANFMTADQFSSYKSQYNNMLIVGLCFELRVMSTTNMVKIVGAGSTNTAIEPSAHSIYEPNLICVWDIGGYGTLLNSNDPQKVPMMPGAKNLHINGHATRFVYHLPKYCQGRTGIAFPGTINTIILSCMSAALEAADVPNALRFYWLDIGDYIASATAAQAATWRVEMRGCVVMDMSQQSIFGGQP